MENKVIPKKDEFPSTLEEIESLIDGFLEKLSIYDDYLE